jgi:hypothetical protein
MPGAGHRPDRALIATVRELLDRIGEAEGRENDELEEVVDAAAEEFAALPRPTLVPALLRAVGTSKARRRRAVLLLVARDPEPEAIDVMRTWITDPSPDVRSAIIQTIGADGLEELAPLLAERIANEDDPSCPDMAVFAAGKLRADVCLPAILDLVDADFPRWRLAQALASRNGRRPSLPRAVVRGRPATARSAPPGRMGPREARRAARRRLPRRVPADASGHGLVPLRAGDLRHPRLAVRVGRQPCRPHGGARPQSMREPPRRVSCRSPRSESAVMAVGERPA